MPRMLLDPEQHQCVLHKTHRPQPWVLEAHHVIPLAWTRELQKPESRTIPTCGTGHDAIHHALRSLIKGQRTKYRVDEMVAPFVREAMQFYRENQTMLVSQNVDLWPEV